MRSQEHTRLINAVRKEWGEAESLIRQGELTSGSLALVAVNELRYAGTHLVLGLDDIATGEGKAKSGKELELALRHIRRAKIELRDQLVAFIDKDVHRMMARYGGKKVAENFSALRILLGKLDECKELVIEARKSTRDEYEWYRKPHPFDEKIPELQELHKQLRMSEVFLEPQPTKNDKVSYFATLAGIAAALAGTILAIVAGL